MFFQRYFSVLAHLINGCCWINKQTYLHLRLVCVMGIYWRASLVCAKVGWKEGTSLLGGVRQSHCRKGKGTENPQDTTRSYEERAWSYRNYRQWQCVC